MIVALDVSTKEEAIRLVKVLTPQVKIFKVGLKLFLKLGTEAIDLIHSFGAQVFLDLKFLDIPFQVREACRQMVRVKVAMFTLHTLGGLEMLKEGVRAVQEEAKARKLEPPQVLGVTILTSLSKNDLKALSISQELKDEVVTLAGLAKKAGLDGVVASPQEVPVLRKTFGPKFLIVTPGIRPLKGPVQDHKRVLTPIQAFELGASHLVIGRPITRSQDPAKALNKIFPFIKKNP